QSLFPAPERAAGWSLPPITPDPLADLVLARRGAALGELVSSVLPGPEEIPQEVVELRALVWPIRMVVEVLPRLSDAAVPGASEAAQAALEAVARWLKETIQALPLEVATDWLKAWDAELPPPDRTLALRPFLVDFYRAWLERIPREEVVEQARLLNKLGAALSALGRREEALAATQEAVGIYRQLAATTPQAFLSDLAASLHNLGIWLSELGRREEALAAAQEAVAICRQLAQTHPHAFLPDLARSLNNLGDRLFELGRREEALAAYEEAVRVLAPFFLKLPAAFADRMSSMVWDYIDACRALGREPDEELLGPIRALLGGD
ncbi:MAG TPA: tetratricopeptide repeat protein, partial [Thermoflexus sp.]|nr:tetratricopeptide repeat protein [Thermoflexus sp.]